MDEQDVHAAWRPDEQVRHERAIARKLRRRRKQYGWATLLVSFVAVAAVATWFLLTR